MIRIGIDLGGTKTEIVALGREGEVLLRRRAPTPPDYAGVIALIGGLVEAAESELGAQGSLGVGIPGSLSPASGLVRGANSTWLNGGRLDQDLAARLGREVRLSNDANCLAMSEAADGAGAGFGTVFAVILGTGVGAGIVSGGRIMEGRNRIAGEWGHNPLPWMTPEEFPGPECWCGRRGCIETFLCGPALARDADELAAQARDQAHSQAPVHTQSQAPTGRLPRASPGGPAQTTTRTPSRDASPLPARAIAGDAAAAAALARHTHRLARALAHVINLLDPDCIILGGGLSNLAHLYEEVPLLWGQWVFSDTVTTPLLRARHGDSSGVLGAARLWDTPA